MRATEVIRARERELLGCCCSFRTHAADLRPSCLCACALECVRVCVCACECVREREGKSVCDHWPALALALIPRHCTPIWRAPHCAFEALRAETRTTGGNSYKHSTRCQFCACACACARAATTTSGSSRFSFARAIHFLSLLSRVCGLFARKTTMPGQPRPHKRSI